MTKQAVFIHGGETFDTYKEYLEHLRNAEYNPAQEREKQKRWRYTFEERLGERFEVFAPAMPSNGNAKYKEWKIWFEKVVPHLRDNVILVGHSLGGIFLAKYLSENIFPKTVRGTFLVGAPYDARDSEHSLADFVLPATLKRFEKQGGKIFLFHSQDDLIVPFSAFEKYIKSLPNAEEHIFSDHGHFLQEEFPELVEKIKSLA